MFFFFAPGAVSPCPPRSKPQAARASLKSGDSHSLAGCFVKTKESEPFGSLFFHGISQPHRLAELLPGEAFVFVKGMAVNIQGGTGLRVAQQARHRAHIHTLGDEHTGVGVPQATRF